MMELGPVAIASVAIAAVVVLAVVALVLKALFSRGPRRRRSERTAFHGTDGRIAVLETTDIDERRKLVLVRCDDVEHLIVIGGPSDLLVENDVRKTRPQSATVARTPAPSPMQPAASPPLAPAATPRPPAAAARVPAAMGASLDAAIAAIVPKASSEAPQARAGEPRPPLAPRSAPTPAPTTARPAGRNGEALPAPLPRATPASERRDAAAARRGAPQSQLPARTDHPRPSADRASRGNEANGLPPAQVPWPEADSIEDEIVQALRFEPQRGSDQPAARRDPPMSAPPKPVVESNATLGDLADRLEEALAREISSSTPPPRRAEPEPAEAPKAPEPERGRRSASRERPEKRESRSESRQAATPEPQRETPPAERREEAPVISLNARRREAPDPLEDEMARLLGELTGDTKGR